MLLLRFTLVVVSGLVCFAPVALADTPEQRAKAYLGKMTLDEKIAMVHGNGSGPGYVGWLVPNDRLGFPGKF